jgi:hypothetical protein
MMAVQRWEFSKITLEIYFITWEMRLAIHLPASVVYNIVDPVGTYRSNYNAWTTFYALKQ